MGKNDTVQFSFANPPFGCCVKNGSEMNKGQFGGNYINSNNPLSIFHCTCYLNLINRALNSIRYSISVRFCQLIMFHSILVVH